MASAAGFITTFLALLHAFNWGAKVLLLACTIRNTAMCSHQSMIEHGTVHNGGENSAGLDINALLEPNRATKNGKTDPERCGGANDMRRRAYCTRSILQQSN